MKDLKSTILSLIVFIAILAVSYFITNAFARWMYNRCEKCGSLNAKRRTHCRICNNPI